MMSSIWIFEEQCNNIQFLPYMLADFCNQASRHMLVNRSPLSILKLVPYSINYPILSTFIYR
jgi:hypothetical protein